MKYCLFLRINPESPHQHGIAEGKGYQQIYEFDASNLTEAKEEASEMMQDETTYPHLQGILTKGSANSIFRQRDIWCTGWIECNYSAAYVMRGKERTSHSSDPNERKWFKMAKKDSVIKNQFVLHRGFNKWHYLLPCKSEEQRKKWSRWPITTKAQGGVQ